MVEKKVKPEKTKCMDCQELDMPDLWCPRYSRDVRDPYEKINCRGFVVIK